MSSTCSTSSGVLAMEPPPQYFDVIDPPGYEEQVSTFVVHREIPPPPCYDRSESEHEMQTYCLSCLSVENRVMIGCNHTLCKSCIKKCSCCPKCQFPIDFYTDLSEVEVMMNDCRHRVKLIEFVTMNALRDGRQGLVCVDCRVPVTGYRFVHDKAMLTDATKFMTKFQTVMMKRAYAKDFMKLKRDIAMPVDSGAIAKIANWKRVSSVGHEFGVIYNLRGYCAYCDSVEISGEENRNKKCIAECCRLWFCVFCIKLMAREVRDVNQRCPLCHSKNFLEMPVEFRYDEKYTCGYVYKRELEKEKRRKELL